MALKELTFKSLCDLDDGRVVTAFEAELKKIVADLMDRPADKTARTLILKFDLTPVLETSNGIAECAGADGSFKVKATIPVRKTKDYSFQVNKRGHMSFSSESPDDVNQTTFNDIDPNTGRVNRG